MFMQRLNPTEIANYEGGVDLAAGRYQLEEDGTVGVEVSDNDTFAPEGATGAAMTGAHKLKIQGFADIFKANILRVTKVTPYAGSKKIQHIVLSLNSGSAPLVGSEIALKITMTSAKLFSEFNSYTLDGKIEQFRTIQVKAGDTLAILAARFRDVFNNLEMGSGNANPLFKLNASIPDALFTATTTAVAIQIESPANGIDFVIEALDVTTSRYQGESVDVSNVKVTIPSAIGFMSAPAISSLIPAAVEATDTIATTVNSKSFTLSGAPTVPIVKGMLLAYVVGGKTYYGIIDTVLSTTTGTFKAPAQITAATAAFSTGLGVSPFNEGSYNYDYLRTEIFQTEANVHPMSNEISAESRQVPIGKNSLYTGYQIDYKVNNPDLNSQNSLNGQQVGYFSILLVINSTGATGTVSKLDSWVSTSDLDNKRYLSSEASRVPVSITTGTFTGSPFIQ